MTTYYRSCVDAEAHGAWNIKKGDAGYRLGLDADHDGVACEKATGQTTTGGQTSTSTGVANNNPVQGNTLPVTGAGANAAVAGAIIIAIGVGLFRLGRRKKIQTAA